MPSRIPVRTRRSCSRPTSWRRASLSPLRSSRVKAAVGAVQPAVRIMSVAQSAGAEAFHAFDHAGWQGAARRYDDAFGSLTRQAIDPLLDAAQVRAGARVLDVASGPGYAAAAAAQRGARVTALDFSVAMVEMARSQNPEIEFREGDAGALSFADGSFDAVVMNFGMLHLAQPERAVSEALRALRPGGGYAFTV